MTAKGQSVRRVQSVERTMAAEARGMASEAAAEWCAAGRGCVATTTRRGSRPVLPPDGFRAAPSSAWRCLCWLAACRRSSSVVGA